MRKKPKPDEQYFLTRKISGGNQAERRKTEKPKPEEKEGYKSVATHFPTG
jgi:hypothetical protein